MKRNELSIRHGRIRAIDPEALSATFIDYNNDNKEATLTYDYLLLATGLRREWPIVPKATSFRNYVIDAQKHIAGIEVANSSTVAVIGGGQYLIRSRWPPRITNHAAPQVLLELSLQGRSRATIPTTG